MKKCIYTFCFTLFLLNVLSAQTQADLETAINATDSRTLTLGNDISFDFSRFGADFDDGGELTLKGNVSDARTNPSNAYTLTSSSGAFLEVFDTSTLNLTDIKIGGNTSTGTNFITNNGILNITNSIFLDNLNGQGTSVISNTGNLFIDSSLFENNTVALTDNNEHQLGRGGAIRNSGNALITNSTFRANSSQHGSAIYNLESGVMEIKNSIFENNKSSYTVYDPDTNTYKPAGYAYGSIYNQGTLIVRDSNFLNNTMGSGGAIYNEGITTIYDSTFTSNTANGLGGALTNASGATMTVHNSTFDGNSALGASAAINSAYGGNLNIVGSTIQNHTTISPVGSQNYDRDNGGAIYFYGQQYHWDNGVYVETIPSGHLYIKDSEFLNNTVSRGGGAIYNAGYATIINTTFSDNVASLDQDAAGSNDAATAGAFYDYNQTDKPTIIRDSKFLSNTAYSAGAIYHPTGHLIIDNTLFDNNSAISVGSAGALQNGGANSYLDITNSTFSNNYAGHGGGIFHQSKNAMNINGSTFTGNEARSYGGAMYLSTHEIIKGVASTAVKNNTFITNSTFSENTARSGGSIYLLSNLEIKNSMFNNNMVESAGGAIFVGSDNYHSGIATIYNTSFIKNSAGNGGAISNNGILTIKDSIFEKNEAGTGAAILSYGNTNIYNSIFKNNISTYSTEYTYATGTGVIDGNGTINVFNSSFLNNYHFSSNANDYSAAITGRGTVNILADNGVSLFSGNVSNGSSSSILVRANNEINLFAGNNGTIIINDAIGIMYGGNLHINRDNTQGFATNGVIEINDEIKRLGVVNDNNYSVNLYNGTLLFGSATVNYDTDGNGIGNDNDNVTSYGSITDEVSFNVYGGKVSTANSEIRNTNLGNLNLFSDVLYDFDVDLNNAISDIATATTFNSNGNGFLIDTIHLFGDTDKRYTEVQVSDGSIELSLSEKTVAAYTPMYRYEIEDSKLSSGGILGFTRDTETFRGYNPSLYVQNISLLAGNATTYFSIFSKNLRMVENEYKEMQFSLKPYFSIEKMNITEGFDINNMLYGTIFSLNVHPSISVSIAYNGSNQYYEKTAIFQNGGSISLEHLLNIDNLFVNSMVNVMGNYSNATTMYGKEGFSSFSAGIASNIGYTFTLFDNLLSLQPALMTSYSFSKTLDYISSSGISLQTTPFHSIALYPSMYVLKEVNSSLKVHAHIMGAFPFQFGGKTRANGFILPSGSLNTYLEYGIGLTKQIDSSIFVNLSLSGYALSRFGADMHLSIMYSL